MLSLQLVSDPRVVLANLFQAKKDNKQEEIKKVWNSNILHLQVVPMVHLASYTQSNIVHRQKSRELPGIERIGVA